MTTGYRQQPPQIARRDHARRAAGTDFWVRGEDQQNQGGQELDPEDNRHRTTGAIGSSSEGSVATAERPVGVARHARLLLLAGSIAGPVFVASIVLQPLLKPGYNWLPGSSLALGPHGWIQTATFLVAGALALCGALGVWKVGWTTSPRVVAGPIGLFWWSIGLIGAGLFATDPVAGYPPGVTMRPEYSTHGALHDLSPCQDGALSCGRRAGHRAVFTAVTIWAWFTAICIYLRRRGS